MTRVGPRRPSPLVDLSVTLERLALRIGDRIGEQLAHALMAAPIEARPAVRAKSVGAICTTVGCTRPVAAKSLCKSHYNLMLYHRRKQTQKAAAPRTRKKRSSDASTRSRR